MSDTILLISACFSGAVACFSGIAAIAAAVAILLSWRELKTKMREDFVLWAVERLRANDMREARGSIFALTPEELSALEKGAREHEKGQELDSIRRVCLSFDEIGYFVYKVGLVEFRDILDIYPQTVDIWNKVHGIVKAWRETESPTTFVFFEMMAREEKLQVDPGSEQPIKLYRPPQPNTL